MSKDEIRKLLGGYATDTLTAEEQRLLFEAAMEDQELFDALAEEQSLREVLSDPAARRELRQALEPEPSAWARLTAWWWKPSRLVLAGGLAVAVIATIAVRNITETSEYQQVAVQAPAPPAEAQAAPESKPTEPEVKREAPRPARARRDEGALQDLAKSKAVEQDRLAVADARKADEEVRVMKEEAPAAAPPPPAPARAAVTASAPVVQQQTPSKPMRVAVLNFNSVQGAKQQPDPALTKDLAERLNQAPTQYALVDQNEVNRVLSEKKLSNQALDSQTAASVGRSLGADAVIVGNVAQQQAPQASGVVGGVPGFRQQQPRAMVRGKMEDKGQQQAITAQVIDTRNATNQFSASADNLDRVAAQLAQFKVEGAVTDVNGGVLTINLGAPAGVKAGDRFQVIRANDVLGQLRISSVGASYAVGVFTGTSTPQAGDVVRRLLD